ncbi:MAG: DUF4857 domain-containing protein [Campylobacterales bacterium]|nr:DUF4857 domain-containing protein [Campylobacterales bacterium]
MSTIIHRTLRTVTIITAIIISSIFLPKIYKTVFWEKGTTAKIYYSPVAEEFLKYEYSSGKNRKITYQFLDGKSLTKDEYIQLLPFNYYSYLVKKGLFPEKFKHIEKDPYILKRNYQSLQIEGKKVGKKEIPLHIIIDGAPKYGKLQLSQDLLRINSNNIEFIDLETNQVKKDKSELFQKALIEKGVEFPFKGFYNNSSTMKPFDEGSFIVDNKNHIYQMKMVQKKPIVIDTKIVKKGIEKIFINENIRKEFYGAIVTKDKIFLITYDNFKLIEIPYKDYDSSSKDFRLVVTPVYKHITFKYYDREKDSLITDYIVANHDYSIHEKLTFEKSRKSNFYYETAKEILFPFSITVAKNNSSFYSLSLEKGVVLGFGFNIVLLLIYLLVLQSKKKEFFYYKENFFFITLAGIYGLLAIIFFGKSIKNYDKDEEEL